MNRLQFGPLALLDSKGVSGNAAQSTLDPNSSMDEIVRNATGFGSDLNGKSSAKLPRFEAAPSKDSFTPPSPLAFRFFIPQGYEKNYTYPLIVYLHDRSQNEGRIDRVMPVISTKNYLGVSVAAPISQVEEDTWGQDESTIQAARFGVLEAIESAKKRFPIHHKKVFLIGCGSGGTMAFRIANSDPEKFAGIASINGSFPINHRPLSKVKTARNLDVFWAHFRGSDRFTEQELCSKMSLLHTAGFDLTVRQYPLGDCQEVCPTVFRDVNRWAMDLVCKIS